MREGLKIKIKRLVIATLVAAVVFSIASAVKATIKNHEKEDNTVVVSTTVEKAEE